MISSNYFCKESDLDKIVDKFHKDLRERQLKVNASDHKFFNVFLKSLIRNNLSKIDRFVLSISDK